MSDINPNCDGAKCHDRNGEVRLYPLGGGANLILCEDCFNHENIERILRSFEHRGDWPLVNWSTAKVYQPA